LTTEKVSEFLCKRRFGNARFLKIEGIFVIWNQVYDPFGNMIISTLLAAIPVVVMLVALGFMHIKAHIAAGLGLLAAVIVAVFAYGMPLGMAGTAAMYGGFTGLLPIGWIVLNIIFLQQLAEQNGSFKILQASLSAWDWRSQTPASSTPSSAPQSAGLAI
jgi:hypothetical protein